ncbi:MAG TPA: helix-turn-helix transcriptional regulator [Bryobacteraceae bacterium]|nr:helix-turn-helix transcriptional regulator [Bryobacteraceae bacterium]
MELSAVDGRRIAWDREGALSIEGSLLLVVLDIGRSGMSESEVFCRLQESFPDVPLLAIDGGARRPSDACPQESPANGGLTPHEVRLLKLLVEGHTYKTAAAELGVSCHTIDFHLRSVYGKLQAHSKAEAIGKAIRNGLLP